MSVSRKEEWTNGRTGDGRSGGDGRLVVRVCVRAWCAWCADGRTDWQTNGLENSGGDCGRMVGRSVGRARQIDGRPVDCRTVGTTDGRTFVQADGWTDMSVGRTDGRKDGLTGERWARRADARTDNSRLYGGSDGHAGGRSVNRSVGRGGIDGRTVGPTSRRTVGRTVRHECQSHVRTVQRENREVVSVVSDVRVGRTDGQSVGRSGGRRSDARADARHVWRGQTAERTDSGRQVVLTDVRTDITLKVGLTCARSDVWTESRTDGRTDGRKDDLLVRVEGWMVGVTCSRSQRTADGRTDGCTDGQQSDGRWVGRRSDRRTGGMGGRT